MKLINILASSAFLFSAAATVSSYDVSKNEYKVFIRDEKDDSKEHFDQNKFLVLPLDLRSRLPCGLLIPPKNLVVENYNVGYTEDGLYAFLNPLACPEYDDLVETRNLGKKKNEKLLYYEEILSKLYNKELYLEDRFKFNRNTGEMEPIKVEIPNQVLIKARCSKGKWLWSAPRMTCSKMEEVSYDEYSYEYQYEYGATTTESPEEEIGLGHNIFEMESYFSGGEKVKEIKKCQRFSIKW